MDAKAGHFPADAGGQGVMPNDIPIDGGGIQGALELLGRPVVSDWPEERAGQIDAVASQIQGLLDQAQGRGVDRYKPDFVALAVDPKVPDAFSALEVADAQAAELLAADAVVQERGQDGAVADALKRILGRRLEQGAGLAVAERRRSPHP